MNFDTLLCDDEAKSLLGEQDKGLLGSTIASQPHMVRATSKLTRRLTHSASARSNVCI